MASKRAVASLHRLIPSRTAHAPRHGPIPSITARTCSRLLHQARSQNRPTLHPPVLQQPFRRSYADTVAPKTKRRGRRFLRWTWRLTYLSAIGGIAYVGYGIYLLRTPQEQSEPDPTKKTLVILGTSYLFRACSQQLTLSRYWLGICLPTKEARYRKLQRHRHFPSQLLSLHSPSTIMHYGYHRAQIHYGTYSEYPAAQESYSEILRSRSH